MTENVVSIGPEASVESIARLLLERGISAVPVIGADGRLLGIVSEGDLMRRAETHTERRASWWLELLDGREGSAERYLKSHGLVARDVMTAPPVSVTESTPLEKIATLLEQNRIKRVPVLRGSKVTGIVSRANLLHALVAVAGRPTRRRKGSAPSRREIAREVRAAGQSLDFANVVLEGGVVHLWGGVKSEAERKAIVLAARRSRGVTDVRSHIFIMSPRLAASLGSQ
jgi:CBS domain-containing protein